MDSYASIDRSRKFSNSVLLAAIGATLVACAQPPTVMQGVAALPIARDTSWKKYVLAVPGPYVTPAAVTVEGDAKGAQDESGLVSEGNGAATLTTTAAGSTKLIVDLGVLASGYVEVGVTRSSGAPLRLSYAEAREMLGSNGDASSDPEDFFYNGRTLGTDDNPDGRADVFAPVSKTTVLRSPGLRGSQRYIAITLDGPGSATLDFIRVEQTNFVSNHDGSFLSSDEQLNRAWYASAYAIDLSTIRDQRRNPDASWVIIDGPKRDRVAYAGDLRVVAQAAYYQSGAYRQIVRDTINLFACQQDPDGTFPAASVIDVPCKLGDPGPADGSPDGFGAPGEAALARIDSFTAWWVVTLADYMRYTGDRAFVEPLLPVARRAVQFFADHAKDSSLWYADNYNGRLAFSWHTPDKAQGIDAYGNAAYYGALRSLAELERSIAKDNAAADELDRRAEKVRTDLIAKLWDPAAGAMILNSEDPRRDRTSDANAGALLFEMLDEQRARSAMTHLEQKLGTPFGTANSEYTDNPYMSQYLSPYIMAQETLGRFQYGDGAGALRLIRTAWTHMLKNGPGTPWEEVATNGGSTIPRAGTSLVDGDHVDLAHAWSTAVPALSMYVLGVRPVTDGFKEWIVEPQPVDLQWAQGDVPTPAGNLAARWRRGTGDSSFTLTIESPQGTSGQVSVPQLDAARTIAMDGIVVWQKGKAVGDLKATLNGDRVVFSGVTGAHTFNWQQ
jgi:hypothetical protein